MECKHCKRVFILLFWFSNGGYKLQIFFHFRTHKAELEMFAKEFSRKKEEILISLQSYLKLIAFRKNLKVVESERLMCGWMEFSCEIISKSKWKVKSKFFFIFANPRFSKFKRSIFQLFFSTFEITLINKRIEVSRESNFFY